MPYYTHIRVHIKGLEILVVEKFCVLTKQMIPNQIHLQNWH